jgi:hypothetical protein
MDKNQARRLSPLVWGTAAVGIALLVVDHWAHVLGVLPYIVLLACPLMHVFMHRGHTHEGRRKERHT